MKQVTLNKYHVEFWNGQAIDTVSSDVYLAGLQALCDMARYNNVFNLEYIDIKEITLIESV